jgi:hypothetical protein
MRETPAELKARVKKILAIDGRRLDEEWFGQPDLFFDFAAELSEARAEVDRAEARLDVVKAQVEKDVRSDPPRYGFDKVTERVAEMCVTLAKPVQDAQAELIETKLYAGILGGAVNALEHRKKALENTVQLDGRSYFAAPREKGPAKGAMAEARDARVMQAVPVAEVRKPARGR